VQTNKSLSPVEYYDVVICGAGPAGATCALALGRSGLKVALIDKEDFPRDKICGDAVAAYVPKVLATIDPSYALAMERLSEKEKVSCLRIVAPNEKILDLHFPEQGCISMRMHFDQFLLGLCRELSNVKIILKTPVEDIVEHQEGITIQTADNRIETKLVIGCDGAHSIVKKKLTSDKMDLAHHSSAVRAYYKNVQGIPASTFELHFMKNILPGYFWIFPLPNGFSNVGLGLLSKTISDRKINLRGEMKQIIENVPYLKERFAASELQGDIKGFGLPLGSRKVTISGKHFMLCGDAASLIDPVTGEGIGQAMISGRYAGWQAIKCFKENNFSGTFMKNYDKAVYDKLWKDHRKRYRVQQLIGKGPWVINQAVNLASGNGLLRKAIKKLIW